jgi:hypothetical protein
MGQVFRALALSLALVGGGFTHGQAAQVDVPVRIVALFSSGVGYFEHAGTVTEDTTAELRFKTNQINDILKSLVLEDADGGRVSAVVYPSQDPLAKTLRSFQVDITGNPSLAQLLNQLRGAKVLVGAQAELISGTILGVEKKQKAVGDKGQIVEAWALNLVSGANLRSVPLDEVQKMELEDAQLQEELAKALQTLSQARDQDKKPVAIHFQGKGERRVRLGYVVETPVWKTSYRLILPAKPEEKPKLQGWAIVENQTDNDWTNVQLSLVSGRPISFVQDLYQPLYIPRPVVQPDLYASLRPQIYGAGIEADEKQMERFAETKPEKKAEALLKQRASGRKDKGKVPEAPTVEEGDVLSSVAGIPKADRPLDATAGVVSVAAAAKVGELFQYTVGGVSLPRQRSAMIPIVTDEIEAERVSIYNQGVLPKNPLQGVRVTNTTGKHLLEGPLTVLDGHTYAGDARIDNLPPGQGRLLSYAVDQQMQINATNSRQDTTIQTGKIVKGVLHLTRKHVFTQEYVVENKADKDRTVIIEHPFRAGWKLVESPQPMETTETLYRFKDAVASGKTARLAVKEESVQSETLAVLPADLGQLEFFSRTGEIPAAVRSALVRAMDLKSAMLDTQRQIQERQKESAEITQEQERIRANMRTVTQNSQYYTRLLTKLNDQETRIEKLQGELDRLKGTYERQQRELETYLLNTTVG